MSDYQKNYLMWGLGLVVAVLVAMGYKAATADQTYHYEDQSGGTCAYAQDSDQYTEMGCN